MHPIIKNKYGDTQCICEDAFPEGQPTTLNTPHYFPPNNFTYSWTLFSKFFSSFPHGTCLLSVSTLYLALGQLYVPLQVAISSNPTLRTHVTDDTNSKSTYGTVTLYGPPFQMVISWLCTGQCVATLQLDSMKFRTDFQVGLFPVHSPLLRES